MTKKQLIEESEDEKIRKAILWCIRTVEHELGCKNIEGLPVAELESWLEKQGKHHMGISEATKQKLEDNLNKALQKETLESWNEFLERQGEQKHIPKHKVGDTIYYNSFGEVKSMIVANVVTDSTDNPMYEDKEYNAVFEKDLIEQNSADNLDTLIEESNQQQANALIDMVTEERDMATITEDYVSFEVAKLLKEKGFDEKLQYYYDADGILVRCRRGQYFSNKSNAFIAPTLQMAMKWLREKCYCHIVIDYTFKADANLSEEYVSYCYSVENAKTYIHYTHNEWYSTYEEACEAAIKYCLENLI